MDLDRNNDYFFLNRSCLLLLTVLLPATLTEDIQSRPPTLEGATSEKYEELHHYDKC